MNATPSSSPVHFDAAIGREFLRYAAMVAARGYVHNTLGNMAVRAAHPDHVHGVTYTKHAGISLEEMGVEHIVITDIPSPKLLYGSRVTSIGHNLNREILRQRPDINAVIHVHDDASIAFFGAGFTEVQVISLDMPFILGKDPYYLPAHVDVEADVGPVQDFIHGTNLLVLVGHGVTALGRTLSEAYHRLNSFTSEVRRNIQAEKLTAITGKRPAYRSRAEIETMYTNADAIINPTRATNVMQHGSFDMQRKDAATASKS